MSNNKIGRNMPCPCKSGKKYKKCCMERILEESHRKTKPESSKPTGIEAIASMLKENK